MRTWNMFSFDELNPRVLTSVDKSSSASIPIRDRGRHRERTKSVRIASIGAALLVMGITASPLQVCVSGSDNALRIRVNHGISNSETERLPLYLLFGGKHSVKWDAQTEDEMLERALAATQSLPQSEDMNRVYAVNSALHEGLPPGREGLIDLTSLGVKRGKRA
jgi:hypothetical protein